MESSMSRRTFLAASTAGLGMAAMGAGKAVPSKDAAAMPKRKLGKLGWEMSLLGFGGGSRFILQTDMAEVEGMIDRAVELGVTYFDTAHAYTTPDKKRESHLRYGKFLTPFYRKQITLISKLGGRTAEAAKREMDETLADLKTDHLDICHFHSLVTTKTVDTDKVLAKGGALEIYRKWKETGVIRAIGISSHANPPALLDAMKRIEPDVVMCPVNPGHGKDHLGGATFNDSVLPYAREHGIGVVAMKPTGRGGLTGKNGVTAEELVRYAMSQPLTTVSVGIDSLIVLESCARVARTLQPMTAAERSDLEKKLASVDMNHALPYLAAGYVDGPCWA